MARDEAAAVLGSQPQKRPRQASSTTRRTGEASAPRDHDRAETREQAEEACEQFQNDYAAKYPKAVASLIENQKRLLTFFDFPAEHWEHIRSANPIESAFATLRLHERATKGAGSRAKAPWMAYKLLDMASLRWRRVNSRRSKMQVQET